MQDLSWMLTGKRWGRDEAGEAGGTGRPRPAELLDVRVEHLLDFTFADRTYTLFHYLATLEE